MELWIILMMMPIFVIVVCVWICRSKKKMTVKQRSRMEAIIAVKERRRSRERGAEVRGLLKRNSWN